MHLCRFAQNYSYDGMEKGAEMCPSSNEDHCTDVLEDTISTLKRCLALTDKTNDSEETKGNTVNEETDVAVYSSAFIHFQYFAKSVETTTSRILFSVIS